MKGAVLLAALLGLAYTTAQFNDLWQGELVGHPHVSDGDSLTLNGTRIRIFGIDAPETDQTCEFPSGEPWPCGIEARDMLRRFVGDDPVSCTPIENDRYGRTIATCTVRDTDVGAAMVRDGMALAYRHYSKKYVGEEELARKEGRGIWTSKFDAPWDYRREKVRR